MDFSRMTRGAVEVRREPILLRRVADDAVENTRPLLESLRHQLTTEYPPEPLPVHGDPSRIEQIINNLLTNAAKYTEPGGRIHLSIERQRDRAVLRVRDNGIGIEPEKLPHVFNLYEQFGLSERRSRGGLGIGLAIVCTTALSARLRSGLSEQQESRSGAGSPGAPPRPAACRRP
jgi:signal transduction histidine kinase